MPSDLQKHIRYPEDLFLIQSQLYRAYHMGTPEVFYNREDLWQFPRQPSGIDDDSADSKMAPYYINMRLPGETHTEFVLMLPMVPSQRENMIAWLAARCDPPDYGKLIVYEFPKDKLVYGPYQIEALINQNTEVSQANYVMEPEWLPRDPRKSSRCSHWKFNFICDPPLSARPVRANARTQACYRHLWRSCSNGRNARWRVGRSFQVTGCVHCPRTDRSLDCRHSNWPASGLGREALAHYNRAIARLRAGDWTGFGTELDALRPLLEQLNKAAPSR